MITVLLDQRTDEWKDWRRKGVTATDSCVLLGCNPYKSPLQLWEEKTGKSAPPDLSGVSAVRFGCENEERVRAMWEKSHGAEARPVCGEYDANPAIRASFDGLTEEGCPVEIKCPVPDGATLRDVKERGRAAAAFALYYVQVQHQLLVSGADKGRLVFLDGDSLIEFEIERDEAMIAKIIEKSEAFLRCLEEDVPPDGNF